MRMLLLKKSIKFDLSEQLTYKKIGSKSLSTNELWTIYFQTGYLTIDKSDASGISYKIPNLEIYFDMQDQMRTIFSLSSKQISGIANGFLNNNFQIAKKLIETYLTAFNKEKISKFFWKGNERLYHLLFITFFGDHRDISINSEISTGKTDKIKLKQGYYDIAVIPKEKSNYKKEGKLNKLNIYYHLVNNFKGYIFEIGAKWVTHVDFKNKGIDEIRKTASGLAQEKHNQIIERDYLSFLEPMNTHIKVWHLIGVGCVKNVVEFVTSVKDSKLVIKNKE